MHIELWPITRLKPYPQNPRVNDQAVDAVARSLQEFGFRQPIVAEPDGTIVVGHTRYKAALKLGLTEVPVHVAEGLTPAQLKAYRIADNATAAIAEWDTDLLPLELAELQGMDFELGLLGFSDEDLAKFLGTEVQDGLTDPDDVPEPPDEAVTQTGDLWKLGDHRLLCGDSSKAGDVDRLLDRTTIHLVNTYRSYVAYGKQKRRDYDFVISGRQTIFFGGASIQNEAAFGRSLLFSRIRGRRNRAGGVLGHSWKFATPPVMPTPASRRRTCTWRWRSMAWGSCFGFERRNGGPANRKLARQFAHERVVDSGLRLRAYSSIPSDCSSSTISR